MSRIVLALGGNALGNTPPEQQQLVKDTAQALAGIIAGGHELIITHGNGPQVGMINLAFETAAKVNNNIPEMPFPECGAMSQGYIGFHLQNALQKELTNLNFPHQVATIITQVVVKQDDPAFLAPTKPIGSFYTEDEAKQIAKEKAYVMKEDAGRGYRRVVPSPKPVGIVELDTIKTLVAAHHPVITVGGGGIPVIWDHDHYRGVAAVIDKDWASAVLADELNADLLVILTAVDFVAINYGKHNQKNLQEIKLAELKNYLDEGHFAKGSMLPKIEAVISFVEKKPHRQAIIASLQKVALALSNQSGTKIVN
ncbi:MAG TPA: carbamate kinase [Bacilli bacterium]|nr:MAG: Carbamate kinase 1 [Tenericutes bacterium ADurb.BinA124]HNZ50919.1 carbamate kinase [Bacilli bacterium]HPX84146.1 carbamate kinase [Bacilli bacterium]